MVMLVYTFLETLKSIDESIKRLVRLAGQERNDAIELAKRQKRYFYITTALSIIAILVRLLT
jgi:hypothetical protein